MKGIKDWFSGLTSGQKMFVVIAALIVAYIIYRSSKGTIQGIGGTVQNQSTLAVLNAGGVKPSHSNADYDLWANRLEYAMDGGGTTEQIIYNVYGYMKNDADITKLDQAFGIRGGYDLNEWLFDDLDAPEIARINKMLKDKGIKKLIK